MGAELCLCSFKDSDSQELKNRVHKTTEQMAYESGHSYSGTWASAESGVQITNKEFDSLEKAENYIDDNHQKWDCVIAVKYLSKGVKRWLVGGWCSS